MSRPRLETALVRYRACLSLFACPVCASAMQLIEEPLHLVCDQRHAFDIARQGYVNLLLSHQTHSLQSGYDAEMLRAREALLQTGLFDPLLEMLEIHLQAVHAQQTHQHRPLTVLDAGSGEGYLYARLISRFIDHTPRQLCAVGTDISKPGMRLACRHDAPVLWCVANLMRQLPFADSVFDLLLNILAPANPLEYQRIISDDGWLLKVLPLPHHLAEIRQAIYERERKESHSSADTLTELATCFTLLDNQELLYKKQIGHDLTANLLAMSPLIWKGKRAKIDRILAEGLPEVTIHLSVTLWEKQPRSSKPPL